MKKGIAAVLATVMLLSSFSALAEGLDNFVQVKTYEEGVFSDVHPDQWFYNNVVHAYQYGLASGMGDGTFSPDGQVSIAEAVTFASRLNRTYFGTGSDFSSDGAQNWYDPYIAYAEEQEILEKGKFAMAYERAATRGEVAYIFSRTLPEEEYECINTAVNSIPDMGEGEAYYSEALLLFRAGVLTGKDEYANFAPNDNITRAEIAAMIDRIIDRAQRKYFIPTGAVTQTPTPEPTPLIMNAEQIAEQAGPGVFYIELYDWAGKALGSGSGFFIDEDGTAVTNYHVVEEAYSAKAFLTNGEEHDISMVLGYSEAQDLAVIKVDGSGFPALTLADSDEIKSGQQVFCVGSPEGLDNSITEGIISNPSREFDGTKYFQMSAPISHGSSGGAVLNNRCEVIGVSSAGVDDAQNLNFAVPSNEIATIDLSSPLTFAEFYDEIRSQLAATYMENSHVPDFAAVTGVTETDREVDDEIPMAIYRYPYTKETMDEYFAYLEAHGWRLNQQTEEDGIVLYQYINGVHEVVVGTYSQFGILAVFMYITEGSGNQTQVYYPLTKKPDYTWVTGVPLKTTQELYGENRRVYVYPLDDNLEMYFRFLERNGYSLIRQEEEERGTVYIYQKESETIRILVLEESNEIYIYQ